jgi:hypothetical protein
VLVVAAADCDAVEAQLRPQLGDLLCVVTSRWTEAELDAIRAHLTAHWEEWNLYGLGPLNGDDGQTRMAAQLTRVLPEIADWATSLARGILALAPWLTGAQRWAKVTTPTSGNTNAIGISVAVSPDSGTVYNIVQNFTIPAPSPSEPDHSLPSTARNRAQRRQDGR